MDVFKMLDDKFNLSQQICDLNHILFNERYYFVNQHETFVEFFDNVLFRQWPNNMGRLCVKELLYEVNLLEDCHSIVGYNPTQNYSIINHFYNEAQTLAFLQIDLNLIYYTQDACKKATWNTASILAFVAIIQIKLKYICEKMGLQVQKDKKKGYYFLVEKNAITRAAAEKSTEDTAILLYEYTSPLIKNDVNAKRNILKNLANSVEGICSKNLKIYTSGLGHDIFDSLNMLLNNFEIRHSNTKEDEKNFKAKLLEYSTKDWIEIYDTTYNLILDAILIDEYNQKEEGLIAKHKEKLGN